MDFYPWLKLVHIFLAIVAVGFNISYSVWLARASTQPQHLGFALRGVKFMDDRVANPSYAALGLVGIVLVLMRWSFTTPWIFGAIGLYVVLMGVAIALYTPTLSRQIAVYESAGPDAPEFGSLTSRGRALGIFLGVVVVAILVLMVVKPGS
jgi:glucose uptake protein GlcU